MITISALSTQYVQSTPTVPSGINPLGDVVKFAFMAVPAAGPAPNPGATDWKTGSWTVPSPGVYVAQCLVGPANGGVVLAVGTYAVWVQVVDNPEAPTQQVGLLQIV